MRGVFPFFARRLTRIQSLDPDSSDPLVEMRNRFMLCLLTKLLWLILVTSTAAAHDDIHCTRLRVPRASVDHELVHLASFENIYMQAQRLVAAWNMPAYKTHGVSKQLLDAFEDMGHYEASEALVNLTLDHTLAYEVTVTGNVDGSAPQSIQAIVLTAEQPLDETVLVFCERFEIDDCDALHTQLFAFAVRDWGCDDDHHGTNGSAITSAYKVSNTVQLEVTPTSGEPAPLTESGDAPLPILTVIINNMTQNVTLQPDQELELQATILCRQWQAPLEQCATIMEAMRQLTHDHPAFAPTTRMMMTLRSSSGLALEITEPVASRLNPISERVYFDGVWLDETSQAVEERRHVCLYYGYDLRPQICGPFPPEEMWYFERYSLRAGYLIVFFAEPLDEDLTDKDVVQPEQMLAARHFWVVTPTVKLLDVQLQTVAATVRLGFTIETVAFDLSDPEFRVCALIDDALDCFQPRHLDMAEATGTAAQRKTVFHAALFHVHPGTHTALLLLMNSFNKAVAHSEIATFKVTIDPDMDLMPRDPSYFFEPASAGHIQRPTICSPLLLLAGVDWICNLWRHEWGRYSQNGEDGILQSIFHHVGTMLNPFYVEFGTEDARECNTRYLREMHQWRGLLLDGGHANASINLHQEWISPANINALFAKYDVPPEFDLLSIDVDFNDYWILDAIDRTQFSPRVIIIEVNTHVPPNEPRVVQYQGPTTQWDGKTAYFGVSVGAMHVWGTRHGYSLVYCESHGVNCFLIRDDVLASVMSGEESEAFVVSDVVTAEDLYAPPNFFGRNVSYPWPTRESGIVEEWVWLEN